VTKLIHPGTGVVREVDAANHNKIAILKRAGFIPFGKYRAPKPTEPVVEPTVADIVQENAVDADGEKAKSREPQIAIHISSAARKLIEEYELDPSLIEGTGKNGQINKPDVEAYLANIAPEEEEIPTHSVDGDEPENVLETLQDGQGAE